MMMAAINHRLSPVNRVKRVTKTPNLEQDQGLLVPRKVSGSAQIPLALSSSELPCFANFVAGKNVEAVTAVRNFATANGESFIYIHGNSGTGVSHLLQASTHLSSELEQSAFYLSLAEEEISPNILPQLEVFDVLHIDDIQKISVSKKWEDALFHLFNNFRDQNKKLLIGSNNLPENINLQLPDLLSRFSGMVRYHLKSLSDEDKCLAIMQRAIGYGLEINKETANFMLSRGLRDMRAVMSYVDKLDQASMISKRKITIPFIKEVFGW